MKQKKIVAKISIFVIPLIVFTLTYQLSSIVFRNIVWLAMLVGLISFLFMIEIVKPLNNQTRDWGHFKLQDKIIFTICLISQLTLSFSFWAEDLLWMSVIASFLSIPLIWIIVQLFGSNEIKAKLFGSKSE